MDATTMPGRRQVESRAQQPAREHDRRQFRLPPPARAAVLLEGTRGLDRIVEAAGRVTAPLGRGGFRTVLTGEWMGHALHPSLTDLPLGFWTSATALDLLGGPSSRPAARRLVGLGLLAAVPTAASGWSEWHQLDRPVQRLGVVHAGLNVGAIACFGGSWLARRRGRFVAGSALGLVGATLSGAAGYLGGHMTSARRVATRHPAFDDAAPGSGPDSHTGTDPETPPSVTAADVVAVVTAQHAHIAQLLRDVGLASRDARREPLDRLLAYVAGHEAVEEELLHPKAAFASSEDVGMARMREESSLGEQIKRLEQLGTDSEVFQTQFGLIEEAIARHAQAEEQEELPGLVERLSEADAALIVRAFNRHETRAASRSGPFGDMLEHARAEVRELTASQ